MTPHADPGGRDRFLPTWSWIIFDFANTIYSAIVVTMFLGVYVDAIDAPKVALIGVTTSASMIAAAFVTLPLGSLSDRTGRSKQYVLAATVVCGACCAGMSMLAPGIDAVVPLMALFGFANLAYQVGLDQYNVMLPTVASPARQRRVNSLGVAVGYLGIVVAISLWIGVSALLGFNARPPPGADAAEKSALTVQNLRWSFLFAGGAFALFALPFAFFVPRRHVESPLPFSPRLLLPELARVARTARSLPKTPVLLLFFLGNFLCVDVLNTTIGCFGYHLRKAFAVPEGSPRFYAVMMATPIYAFLWGVAMTVILRRIGALRAFYVSVAALGGALAFGTLPGEYAHAALVGVLVLGSLGMGGIWICGRQLLFEMIPPDRLGQFSGFYGVTMKISVIGTAVYWLVAAEYGAREALAVQFVPLVAGFLLLLAFGRRLKPGYVIPSRGTPPDPGPPSPVPPRGPTGAKNSPGVLASPPRSGGGSWSTGEYARWPARCRAWCGGCRRGARSICPRAARRWSSPTTRPTWTRRSSSWSVRGRCTS
ncbi:MAG: MFS transporter [Planctomycetes bacterium]|nr:MFS transporter [Planctomycetota bacterium]